MKTKKPPSERRIRRNGRCSPKVNMTSPNLLTYDIVGAQGADKGKDGQGEDFHLWILSND